MPQYFKIGKLAASTGLKGDLVLQHSLGKKTSLKGLEAIFIEEGKDSFIPYFIQSTKIRSDEETIIKLEGIDIVETARRLTPREVWLAEDDFKKFVAKSSPIALLGFAIDHYCTQHLMRLFDHFNYLTQFNSFIDHGKTQQCDG